MGLDIYVGSYTRYYAGDWETIVQKYGRETGMQVQVIRTNPAEEVVDPDEIRPGIIAWRNQLSKGLGANIDRPLDWDESASSPYFTDKPAWNCYSSLVLWAAYAEQPDLSPPYQCVDDWTSDKAFQLSTEPEFKSDFSQIIGNVEIWLPNDFDFTFNTQEPNGHEATFGSSITLVKQLEELNRWTWNASDIEFAQWRREGAGAEAPLETAAKFAFALMLDLARQAVAYRLMMKLDY